MTIYSYSHRKEISSMQRFSQEQIRAAVRQRYGALVRSQGSNCGCSPSCCSASSSADEKSKELGYSVEDVTKVPEGANLGLGCGDPRAIAALKEGETVLDLGSGGGFDCFLAARAVGKKGSVIGVDMTAEMVALARRNAQKAGAGNVDFRLGEIEHLPVADGSVDVIISNCVINLSPEKPKVFKEAFRVLKSGGRLAISDIIASGEIPGELRNDLASVSACVGGASSVYELQSILKQTEFTHIKIQPKKESRAFIKDWSPDRRIEGFVLSATIGAVKP
jgi:arsenite methyltransferase